MTIIVCLAFCLHPSSMCGTNIRVQEIPFFTFITIVRTAFCHPSSHEEKKFSDFRDKFTHAGDLFLLLKYFHLLTVYTDRYLENTCCQIFAEHRVAINNKHRVAINNKLNSKPLEFLDIFYCFVI